MHKAGTKSPGSRLSLQLRLSCMSVLQNIQFNAAIREGEAYLEQLCTKKSMFIVLICFTIYIEESFKGIMKDENLKELQCKIANFLNQ